jgi:outer membrane protein assembly factor BamB
VGGEGGAGNGGAGGETPDPCVAAGALAPGARWAIEGGTMARCNRSSLEGPSSEATSMALELEDENQGKKFSPQLVVDEEGIPYFQQSNRIFALHRPKGGAGEVREVYAGTSPSTATLLLLPEQRGLRTVVGTDQVTVALVPLVRQGESWTIEEVKTIKAGSAVGFIGLSMQGPEEVLLSINSTAYSFEYPSLKQKPAFATDLMHMLPARDVLQGSTYVCREEGGKVLLEQSGGPTQGLFELPLLNGKSCHVAVGPGGRVYVTSGAAACSLDPANAEFDRPSFSTTVGAEALAPAVRKDGSAVVVFNQESSSVLWSVSAGMELQWKNAFKITEQVLAPPLLDAQGNVYVCTDQQVLSLSPAGKIRWQRGHEQKTPQCALVLSAPGRLDVMTDRYWFRVEAT